MAKCYLLHHGLCFVAKCYLLHHDLSIVAKCYLLHHDLSILAKCYLLHHGLGLAGRVVRFVVLELLDIFLHGQQLWLELVPECGQHISDVIGQLLVQHSLEVRRAHSVRHVSSQNSHIHSVCVCKTIHMVRHVSIQNSQTYSVNVINHLYRPFSVESKQSNSDITCMDHKFICMK